MRSAHLLIAALVFLPGEAVAEDGRALLHIALASKQQNARPPMPWVSQVRLTDNAADKIMLADGRAVMTRPSVVHSYSGAVRYDVSRFYKPDAPQINIIMHYADRTPGEIISLGLDSGYRAEKIRVNPALFLAYTRAVKITRQSYLTAAIGGWLGGTVTEKPCMDSFDREYYCPTLTAWRDYRPAKRQLQRYYWLMWTREF